MEQQDQKLDLKLNLQEQEQKAIAKTPKLSQLQTSSLDAQAVLALCEYYWASKASAPQPMIMPSYGQDRLALYLVGGLLGSLVLLLFMALAVNILSTPKSNEVVDRQMDLIESQNKVILQMKTEPQDSCIAFCGD